MMASRPEIRLDSGDVIWVDCLFQYRTYACLLEGRPTRKLNAELMLRALEYAVEKLWLGGSPHLLTPPEVAMGVPEDEWFSLDDSDEPATIPPVACLGTFRSMSSARNPDADCSSLRVVWFQDTFGPPVDASVLGQFRALDWRALATDAYW